MKYRDLIQFEPVESVIQLREADDRTKAEELVSTYVISDRMADVLLARILPSLHLEKVEESSGLFVVGNYGTGKSHLMSVVSAIAEHSDMVDLLTHPAVAEGLAPIAGRFKVIRQEFGYTNMPLRDVVFYYLEKGLAQMGVIYHFPSIDEVPNSKDPLAAMMAAFHQRYPDCGLLVVIDELLDYLRGRSERELIQDLSFLREMGEICQQTRLRFISGLQESLFDSPRFQFAADSIQRVKDRYEQVRIVRQDVAYVVSRRLLAKTQSQRAQIRRHLENFTSLYDSMAERLEDFVELFPVHPAYLEIFELVTVIEKRQVLKALSRELREWLDRDVPTNQPGLISFDAYWELVKEDAAYRAVPEIREVMDKSHVLEDRINSALSTPIYKPAALRIINALALHRLTVGDLRAPIGLTPKELRDRLCLSIPIPEADAGFLLTSVEAVLNEISKTVSGQFISHNRENDQYYLDLEKDIDFDALIEQKADTLDEDDFDRYYFDMLARALELTDSVYVPGFRIWQREIPWLGQGITRQGYVFLGATNERSTAQPPRDFYIHFLALYSQNGKEIVGQPDEVFFSLTHRDPSFEGALRSYAGAREMSLISTGANKEQYERKADGFLREMVKWLRDNLTRGFEIRYQAETLTPAEVFARARLSVRDLSLRDQIFRLASAILGDYFKNRYPQYPRFSLVEFTTETIPQGADAALKAIAGGLLTRPAQAVLEAFQLGKAEKNRLVYTLDESLYAQYVLEQLHAQPAGKVLNRSALLKGSIEFERDTKFGLEPEWLVVVLVALVRQGEITINLPGRKIDSDDLDEAARMGVGELARFTSISRPKSLPEQALRTLFEGLGLPEGLITDPSKHEVAVQQLQSTVLGELDRTARALEWLREGLRYWREPVLNQGEIQDWRDQLSTYKDFLDSLGHLTTPGRLRNFSYGMGDVHQRLRARNLLAELTALNDTLQVLQPALEYIYQAELNLPGDHPWQTEAAHMQAEHLKILHDPDQRTSAHLRARLNGALANLRSSYAEAYVALHNRARLNTTQDARKKRITSDARWAQLKGLAALDFFFVVSDLQKLEQILNELRSCPGVGTSDLAVQSTCQLCSFTPRTDDTKDSASQKLEQVETDFEQHYQQWVETLRENLKKPDMQANIALLGDKGRQKVEEFVHTGVLPEKISSQFVDALRDALHGLEKVTIDGTDFLLALTKPGMPCTPEEFQERFRAFLAKYIEGKNPEKVRIQIEW
jgi:hypothetical protein